MVSGFAAVTRSRGSTFSALGTAAGLGAIDVPSIGCGAASARCRGNRLMTNIGTRAAIAPSPIMKSLRRRQGVMPDRNALETIGLGVRSVTGAELSVAEPFG